MAVITVTRQYGAGGSEVARRVAGLLSWTVIDNEFVEEVAKRAGLPEATVAAHEERAPSLMQRLVRTLAAASPEVYIPGGAAAAPAEDQIVRVTAHVIAEAAQHGRVVLVGRGAQAVLATLKPDEALHVFVTAPRDARVRTVMERLGLESDEAGRTVDATDAARDRYVERWHQRRRQDTANYHLTLNTAWLGYDGAAALIVAGAHRFGWT